METFRILLISTQCLYTPPELYGGTEEIVALLGYGLSKRGHEITIAAAKGSEELFESRFPESNVEFIEGVKPEKSNPEHMLADKYKDIINDFDIVNYHGWSKHPYDYRKDIFHTIHSPYPSYVSKSKSIAVSKAHQEELFIWRRWLAELQLL